MPDLKHFQPLGTPLFYTLMHGKNSSGFIAALHISGQFFLEQSNLSVRSEDWTSGQRRKTSDTSSLLISNMLDSKSIYSLSSLLPPSHHLSSINRLNPIILTRPLNPIRQPPLLYITSPKPKLIIHIIRIINTKMRCPRFPTRAILRRQDLQFVEQIVNSFVVCFNEPDAQRVRGLFISVRVSATSHQYQCIALQKLLDNRNWYN